MGGGCRSGAHAAIKHKAGAVGQENRPIARTAAGPPASVLRL